MWTVPLRSVFTTLYQSVSSSSMSSSSLTQETPALFTRMSTWPKASYTWATAARTLARSVTSQEKLRYLPPLGASCFRASAALALSRQRMATSAPDWAMARAMPRPSPRLPPVMRAVLPVRSKAPFMLVMAGIMGRSSFPCEGPGPVLGVPAPHYTGDRPG